MAQPTNTFSTYDAIGNREDLKDVIYDVSPTQTPFISNCKKTTASATYVEWQVDALASASSTNAVIEGDDAVTDATTATTRRGNYTQISDKVPRVTATQRIVDSAGRGDELDYQVMKRAKELKRDMEAAVLDSKARVAGNDTTARQLAGVPAWLITNTDAGSGGSDPTGDGTDTRTDGTQRAFAEADLKTVLSSIWDEGGEPGIIMVGSFNKQAMSAFTGNATRTVDAADKRLTTAIDVYVSDFGELSVIPNRFMRARDGLVLDMDYWTCAMLRDFEQTPLSKTGDSDRVQLLSEYTLLADNEKASGIVADLTTS
jgi:hypothetical protein